MVKIEELADEKILPNDIRQEISNYLITLSHEEKKNIPSQLLVDAYFEISRLNQIINKSGYLLIKTKIEHS